MKSRPMLFSAPMVRALLDGSKTQTRRIAPISDLNIKPFSDDLVTWGVSFTKPIKGVYGSHSGGQFSVLQARSIIASQFNPYGQPGDQLWVRETTTQRYLENFLTGEATDALCGKYTADDKPVLENAGFDLAWWYSRATCPAIHMPRFASRITLEITAVRVERLQDISEADAVAEGWTRQPEISADPQVHRDAARDWYSDLWESINGSDSWAANPWVWVLTFRVIK